MLQLLTALPALYVCNVDEGSAATGNALSRRSSPSAPAADGAKAVVISAKIEARSPCSTRPSAPSSWRRWA